MTIVFLVALCLCFHLCTPCPEPWQPHGDSCYFASKTQHTFIDCQKRVCETKGGSLAIVTNKGLNDFLRELVTRGVKGRSRVASGMAFIGYWERLPEEPGDWHWIGDGYSKSNFTLWHHNQPDGKCDNENCVAISLRHPVKSWFDVSCASRHYCTCELGVTPSADFKVHEAQLETANTDDYSQCPVTPGHECFWQASVVYQIIYTLGVLPCLVVTAAILLSMCFSPQQETELISWPVPREEDWSVASSSYGFLVSPSGSTLDACEVVHRWIMRGALISMLYAVITLGIAVARMSVANLDSHFDGIKAFSMCICKLVLGWSALSVHRHLSPVSKAISGNWILAIAWSKFIMAMCGLAVSVVYLLATLKIAGMTTVCVVRFIISWALLTHLFSQCAAGFAFFRIQRCASACIGDPWVFSTVMRCWWNMLIGATLGVGIGVWFRGLTFVVDIQVESLPFIAVMFAAFCEFLAGAAMLLANVRIRAHFRKYETIDTTPQIQSDDETIDKNAPVAIGVTSGHDQSLEREEVFEDF